MRTQAAIFSILMGWGYGAPGLAFEPVQGDFLAKTACPAAASIKHAPSDNVALRADTRYPALGLNKPHGDYVQVRISGARPEQRWVPLSCGELRTGQGTGAANARPNPNPAPKDGNGSQYLLALSWQPAFCEARPDKSECRTGTPARFDASHFTLHGLWPQPRTNVYCKVPTRDRASDERHDWDALPEPALSPDIRARLDTVMPGTASNLQRHEWTKHGTCFGTGPEAYFRTALALMEQVNTSKLQELMVGNIGNAVAVSDLKAAFEHTFGPGSAAAISIECGKDADRTLISGISINLKGALNDATALQEALDTSARPKSRCSQGTVDPAGLN